MEIVINEKPQIFYIALNKWVAAAGHEIRVGEHHFAIIPANDALNVIEVSTGFRVLETPMNNKIMKATATKESAMRYFSIVAIEVKKLVEQQPDFANRMEVMKEWNTKTLGEKPPTEDLPFNFPQ